MYSINFTVTKKKFCLSLHYNGGNGIISKGWSVDYMKKAGFNVYVYDFSVDYDATDVDDILDIHKYWMEKNIV